MNASGLRLCFRSAHRLALARQAAPIRPLGPALTPPLQSIPPTGHPPHRSTPLRPLRLMSSPTAAAATSGGTAPHSSSVSRPSPAPRPRLPPELIIRLPASCQVPAATLPLLHQVLEHYCDRTPVFSSVIDAVMRPGWPGVRELGHDHFAFRTFGVPGLGISSLSAVLTPLGYTRVDQQPPLTFPAKKLAAAWFSPTDPRVRAVLPRVFVSELQVERLSPRAQDTIRGATAWAAEGGEEVTVQVLTSLLTGSTPWPRPTLEQYRTLLEESEYAAWVLAHGYSLNHTALALHRLPAGGGGPAGQELDLGEYCGRLAAAGLGLNKEGGLVKVSPDGMLLQCSVLADQLTTSFACGGVAEVPAAYVEFVKRLPLPQYAHLKAHELQEEHLREGFEVGNADRIFESTNLAAAGRDRPA